LWVLGPAFAVLIGSLLFGASSVFAWLTRAGCVPTGSLGLTLVLDVALAILRCLARLCLLGRAGCFPRLRIGLLALWRLLPQ